jgi:hypothetical protein
MRDGLIITVLHLDGGEVEFSVLLVAVSNVKLRAENWFKSVSVFSFLGNVSPDGQVA